MTTQPPPSAHMAQCRLNRHWGCETMLFFWRGYLDRGGKKKYTAQALGFFFSPLHLLFFFFKSPCFHYWGTLDMGRVTKNIWDTDWEKN
ncbi:hypothetical protein LZ31DRAFT_126880 [Colletotrichum somersetense]|nr:hypothetical protein LZ31DRAFT_126880 [Colletotrichum somersetense]